MHDQAQEQTVSVTTYYTVTEPAHPAFCLPADASLEAIRETLGLSSIILALDESSFQN